jgi:hypothetical protein
MIRSIICSFIVVMTLLFCFPCFASENNLRFFDTDYFTIKLPVHMSQLSNKKMPPPANKNNFTYAFGETNKARKKSILLVITLEKIDNPEQNLLKEIAKTLRDRIASHTDCRSRTSELTETRIAGQKCYYFEKRSENCVVTLERYWTTINSNHAFSIYLARPGKSEDAVSRNVVKEIVKIKLK